MTSQAFDKIGEMARHEALNEKVSISENGSRKMITKREALAKQVANKGATVDLKSIKLLFEILEGLDDRERVTRSEDAYQPNSTARERINKKLDQMRERMDAQQKLIKKDQSFAQ